MQLTTEIGGWKELSFTVARIVNGKRNFRWQFLRSGYLVRLVRDGVPDWFLLHAPRHSHKGQAVTAVITCEHVCSLLAKKNVYLTFDDTNGIGTAQHLLEQVLAGTGWSLGYCETFYEADGTTEKIRSLSSDGKRGAYQLIADICKIFSARPEYDGDARKVNIHALNRCDELLELNFGKNLTAVERKEDAADIVTRLFVEGEYSDSGYVGIDEANPTGLPFLLNFDYFRQLGVFTEAHEAALASYLSAITAARKNSMDMTAQLNALDNSLNELWGQIDYVVYVLSSGTIAQTILGGDAKPEQAVLGDQDALTVLLANGTHITQTGSAFPAGAEYAVKFIQKSYAVIGGKEVAIEAKEASIKSLEKRLESETNPAMQQKLQEQIAALQNEIELLYHGTDAEEGLYSLMRRAVQAVLQREPLYTQYLASMDAQNEIEQQFAEAMGDMLRDGYWSNTSYAAGQGDLLYLEACEVMDKLAKPDVTYTVSIQNLSGISGYEKEQFKINTALRIWDEQLSLNDRAYVTRLIELPAKPESNTITISNDLTHVGGLSLDGVIARITGIAEAVEQKTALYDRSKAISQDGTIPAKRLEGMIDVLRTRLTSSASNWYTDEAGNIILEAATGKSAMKLCGEGFMIADGKTDNGAWDWRTFGTGEGFSADMLITGFLSAERIEAHSITANKLAADVGQALDLSSNVSINLKVRETVDEATDTMHGEIADAQAAANAAEAKAQANAEGLSGLTTRVSSAESEITQMKDDITLRVTKTEMDSAVGTVEESARQALETATGAAGTAGEARNTADAAKAAADANDEEISTLTERVSSAELKLQSDAIVSTVTSSEKYQNDLEALRVSASGSELIIGTQTATTAAWTGDASFTELKDGQEIAYWLPYSGASNVTLALT